MSDYWKMVIATLNRVSVEGSQEEQEETYRIIQQIEETQTQRYGTPETPLAKAWDAIRGYIEDLKLEPYIDDQYQIWEISETVEDLLRENTLENEPWDLKAEILQAIYENDYYDYFSVYDAMQDLEKAMCTTPEEKEKAAELLRKHQEEEQHRRRRRR